MLYAATISAPSLIRKNSDSSLLIVEEIQITASADGDLTLTDGFSTLKLHVTQGVNSKLCIALPWRPGTDLTLTPSAEMTVIAEYQYR